MTTKLDLVLINPGSRTQVYQSLGTKLTAVENPVWAGLMATFCRRKGLAVAVIDAEAEELVPDEVAERVQDLDPVLAAVVVYGHQPSASTQMMTASGQVCTAIKQLSPEQPVLLVGGHVAALPERTLAEEDADYVAAGEGLHTLIGLVEALKTPSPEPAKVPGLWYRDGGQVCHTPDWPLVAALGEEMPGPAWDLLPMGQYRAHNWHCLGGLDRQPYAALYTTLGCPYHCSFCLAKGTTIVTAQGRNKKIQNVRVGDKLMAWDEKEGKLSHTTVVATGCRVVADLLRVETADGFTLLITDEHPVYTRRGWVEAGELTTEDEVWAMEPHDKVSYLRMQRAEVAAQVSETQRELIGSSEIVPWMCTEEGRASVTALAERGQCPHFTRVARITRVGKGRGKYKVYNFQCSPHDNYFAEHLLVHNCCIQAPFKSGERAAGVRESANSYRYWDPDTVLAQIDVLVNRYGVRNLKIADEMFVLNRRHVLAICDRLIEGGYGLNIWAYTRVDTVKDGMLDKLKAAGFNWLAFGIEAGAARVRAGVDKAFDQDEVYRVLGRVRAAGINVIGNYIFGLPEDDAGTMQATLDLALDLKCEFANFYSAMAYPGSPLYTLAVRQGVPLPERWTGYSQHSRDCLPLPTRHVTAPDVLRFRDEAFLRYYTDAGYLETVEHRFGPETVAHLRQMTAYRLERDLLTGKLRVPAVTLPAAGSGVADSPLREVLP
jgi:radical SAM superfamily enzyme YgiQ (UPF0313 family)